ncbi:MAG: Gfo/Idh/MocA family protein [Christensenellales bacterium]|jgi:predicted dehydrogenase
MIKIGIVGTGMRAKAFKAGIDSMTDAAVTAVCDVSEKAVLSYSDLWKVKSYTDYIDMLDNEQLDAVIISTPVSIHVEQSVQALARNIHVYSEIPAAATIEECKLLVEAAKKSRATYVLGENMVYMKEYMTIANMIHDGLFGQVYYFLGEYLHDIKSFFEISPWRKSLMAYKNGITYGTHSLAPMLIWMKDSTIKKVLCVGSGHHYLDPVTGKPYIQENGCLMVCKTDSDCTIDIRVELMSTRPYSLNYRLQGTKGAYENYHDWTKSSSRIWIDQCSSGSSDEWQDFGICSYDYEPDIWKKLPKTLMEESTHWGVDIITMQEWIAHLRGERPFAVDIYKAMDITLPGIISTQSIEQGGIWLDVPNSREWETQ